MLSLSLHLWPFQVQTFWYLLYLPLSTIYIICIYIYINIRPLFRLCKGMPKKYLALCSPYRRKFRSQTSDNMDRWKAEKGRGREKRKIRRKKSRRERVRRKKMQMREKVGKSRNTVCFPMIWGSGGSKSRLAKAAGAEPSGQMRDEKLYAVVARSTFPSQNVQNTRGAGHFWQLRCRKSARRCGAKHISKSKCTKH